MLVAFATPEVFPYSKTGGLADVSAALPKALADLGHELIVFSPYYRQTREYFASHPDAKCEPFQAGKVWIGDDHCDLSYFVHHAGRLTFVFPLNNHYFDRERLYTASDGRSYLDSVSRYSFFCRAVLAYLAQNDLKPAIVHANDWQCALLPVYVAGAPANTRFAHTKSVLTIHNLGFQGTFPAEQIYATGLPWDRFTIDELEFYGSLNLLKGGIADANAVTTVSPTYAKEIQTAEYGFGLGGFLLHNNAKLNGILNGIDTDAWNPATDHYLPAQYSTEDLAGKAECKAELQQRCGLNDEPEAFLLGVVSRLDRQKGIHLICEAYQKLKNQPIQLVVLGSGAGEIEHMLSHLASKNRGRVAFANKYDEGLAHLIEAGADAFLMPSAYEPCGLNQMYSQRYGTVPIIRETGGLKDTVTNYTALRLENGQATGFSFRKLDGTLLLKAIRAAAKLYFDDRPAWKQLMLSCMAVDHGWPARAQKYDALYKRLTASRIARGAADA